MKKQDFTITKKVLEEGYFVSIKEVFETVEEAQAVIEKIVGCFDREERSVSWSVLDFEHRAEQLASFDGRPVHHLYDESKYADALQNMINNHDANHGITWETIDCYLDSDCRR